MPLTPRRGAGAFVCTANSARSHLAATLWRRPSSVAAASAGAQPAAAIDPGAIAAARRHRLPLPRLGPRHISEVQHEDNLVATVCDMVREELGGQAAVHWSVPDPVPTGDPASFDAAISGTQPPCPTPGAAPDRHQLNPVPSVRSLSAYRQVRAAFCAGGGAVYSWRG
jgi:protein-tyrosine-phosphatase